MVNVKKYNSYLKLFILNLTLIVLITSCSQNYSLTKIEGKQVKVTEKSGEFATIENYISPYRNRINKDLDSVLAYCPETLDKSSGIYQTKIGDLMADVVLEKTRNIFKKRENKTIDICLLNNGGIRAILPKGNVTTRTAFEIMPFENTALVLELKGEQLLDIANFIILEKKPHPVSGITFTIDVLNKVKNIKINNQDLQLDKTYFVVTNDYLANGGDNMVFFKKAIKTYDLNYKLRNILIDYFKEIDTIPVAFDIKITKEN